MCCVFKTIFLAIFNQRYLIINKSIIIKQIVTANILVSKVSDNPQKYSKISFNLT